MPDGLVGEIRDKYLKPQLQAGNYGEAFYDTVYAFSSIIAKDAGVQLSGSPAPYRTNARAQQKGVNVFGLIFFFIAAVLLLGTRTGRAMLPWILLLFLSGGRGGGVAAAVSAAALAALAAAGAAAAGSRSGDF